MAVEPSWLADQLVLFYLPLWAAGVLRRTSGFGRKGGWPWVETVLLAWGSAVLLLTSSRSGYAAWGAALTVLAIGGGWMLGSRSVARLWRNASPRSLVSREGVRRIAGPAGAALAVGGVIGIGLLAILLSARLDRRMDRLLHLDLETQPGSQQPVWLSVANQLEYGERVAYWTAASRVFALHPVVGVGLGNSGFYFREVIPATGYDLLDVLGAVGGRPGSFPNPKSLWFRLLAETGVVGFVLFGTWLLVVGASAWQIVRRPTALAAVVGLATLLSLAALLVEGFSLDTFALPYMWLLPGLTTGLWAQRQIEGG
jgi:O-antigen ligase